MSATTTSYLSAKDVQTDVRAALIDLLYRLGDDSLIIGHRNSEWTGIGPILEEDIAFSSMAQDKMGHALAFYTQLHELGEPDPDEIAFARSAEAYRCCSLVALDCVDFQTPVADLRNNPVRDRLTATGDWGLCLVRQFLFSEADALRMAALEHSAYEPLAQLARKLRGELKYHTLHGRTLMNRLASGTDESRGRIQRSFDQLFPHALGLFEPTRWDATIQSAGLAPSEAALCDQWRAAVEAHLSPVGLRLPREVRPIYGGRQGKHAPELAALLEAMQKVYRMAPGAKW